MTVWVIEFMGLDGAWVFYAIAKTQAAAEAFIQRSMESVQDFDRKKYSICEVRVVE